MDFAERIRRLRRAEHLTQAALAQKIGLTTRGYQDIELGSLPRYENLLRIAEYYDVSVDWLMGRTEDRYAHRGKAE
ncbi:helix-turn-helix transcriptional regulator [Oscillibacter sp.]|jgi:transcriptional regulator with XRE-family HTH domain|uniref:helix-turn-helix domain-containing protein n=1 Tax=Oscillibacter sp. TaxID=1945593 RepID=UPI0021722371|nr:helix-turn-helix transcriptional regulator [Oscillibacter sp.]